MEHILKGAVYNSCANGLYKDTSSARILHKHVIKDVVCAVSVKVVNEYLVVNAVVIILKIVSLYSGEVYGFSGNEDLKDLRCVVL